jgi:acyl-CoA reductase-like NAD-dependent aldehyde dehydrogenase
MLSKLTRQIPRSATAARSLATLAVDNPYTGEVHTTIKYLSSNEMGKAVEASGDAQRAWSRESNLQQRIELVNKAYGILKKNADSVASDVTSMMGKPLGQAKGEINTSVQR